MAGDIAADALASYLDTININYGAHAAAFVAAGFKNAQELRYCHEADVPNVPKGALRVILSRAAGTGICMDETPYFQGSISLLSPASPCMHNLLNDPLCYLCTCHAVRSNSLVFPMNSHVL